MWPGGVVPVWWGCGRAVALSEASGTLGVVGGGGAGGVEPRGSARGGVEGHRGRLGEAGGAWGPTHSRRAPMAS